MVSAANWPVLLTTKELSTKFLSNMAENQTIYNFQSCRSISSTWFTICSSRSRYNMTKTTVLNSSACKTLTRRNLSRKCKIMTDWMKVISKLKMKLWAIVIVWHCCSRWWLSQAHLISFDKQATVELPVPFN